MNTTATSREFAQSQRGDSAVATATPIVRYVHPDNLGSTAVTSDANGNLAQWLDYAPFGSLLASSNTGTTTVARQYIGQYSDPSGLDYLNARYYNGAQGQFLSQGPVFLETPSQQNLQNPQSLNSYSYSEDNPITGSDPNGKQADLAASYGTGYMLGSEFGPYDLAVGTIIGTGLFIAANSSPRFIPTSPGSQQVFQESIGQGSNTNPEFGGKTTLQVGERLVK